MPVTYFKSLIRGALLMLYSVFIQKTAFIKQNNSRKPMPNVVLR